MLGESWKVAHISIKIILVQMKHELNWTDWKRENQVQCSSINRALVRQNGCFHRIQINLSEIAWNAVTFVVLFCGPKKLFTPIWLVKYSFPSFTVYVCSLRTVWHFSFRMTKRRKRKDGVQKIPCRHGNISSTILLNTFVRRIFISRSFCHFTGLRLWPNEGRQVKKSTCLRRPQKSCLSDEIPWF